jgi:hypothetical protein
MVSKGEFLPAPDEVRLERVIRHFQNQLDLFEKNIDERNFDAFAISVDDGGSVFSWQWMEVPLNLYALPVPFPVLEHAAVIKKEFPEAEFTVEHLTNRNPLKLLSQPLLASFKSTIQGCLEPLVEEYQRQEQERLAQYEALRSMERESQRKQQAQREQAVAAAQVGAKRATALLDAATKVRKGSLALQDIDFKEHGVTAREVHWYLYDPFLKMRLRDDDGSYEDLYLFVWDEPGFQATILD